MNKLLIITGLLFISVFWIFWLPGPRVATDYYLSSQEIIRDYTYPWVWRENSADGLGEYIVPTLWSQPIHLFFRIISELSIPVIWITKLFFMLILLSGFLSVNKLLTFLKVKRVAKIAGGVFYLSNSFFLLLVDGGQLSLALAYVIIPFNLYLYFKLLGHFSLKNRLNLMASILIISYIDLRFIFLIFMIIFAHLIFKFITCPVKSVIPLLKEMLITGTILFFVLLLGHIYWLIPAFLSQGVQLPQTYERVSQVDFLSWSSISHSIFLQQPHWYKNIFGLISPVNILFSFIPVLAFSAIFIKKRDERVGFFVFLSLIGIFLSKGSQNPFGFIYNWFFVHVPGFSMFRDPVKFYLFIALSYCILISITLDKISEFKLKSKMFDSLIRLVPFFVIAYFIFLMQPIFFGKMTGLFSEPRYEYEYLKQNEIFAKDNTFSRIFWLPGQGPLGYTSLNHPSLTAFKLAQKRPFAVGVKGTYETFNFLRDSAFTGELFDVAGIGYVNYPYLDSKRSELSFDNIRYYYLFFDQLANLNWLTKIPDSKIPLLKVNKHQDRFFVTPNVWLVIGSDSIYNDATRSASLNLSKNALVFAEEYPGAGNIIDELKNAKVILNGKSSIDLAASFISERDLIFPAKQLDFHPDSSGWWKREASDLINWRAFLQDKYRIDNQDFDLGGGWAVGEGDLKLKIKSDKFKNGNILLARVMESSRSGKLKFYQDDQMIGEIPTRIENNTNVRWFEIGQLVRDQEMEIVSSGDINVVNALAILDKQEWFNLQNKGKSVEGRIKTFEEANVTTSTVPTVTYKKLNPTKYIVNIDGLKDESFLIFSQNFNPLWKTNGQSSFPVYSLLNGFEVKADGEYIVEFEAQRYVDHGLIISGFAVSVFLFFLIKYSRQK